MHTTMAARHLQLLGAGLALALLGAPVAAQGFKEPCARSDTFARPAVNGPFDYRNQRSALQMVENNHYIPQIENLVRGKTGTLASEHSFVLHGFPNHHRALASLARYGLREKSATPGNLDYTVDCYFERALVFRPDDYIVRMLFADYLTRTNRIPEAAAQLDYVRNTVDDNPMTHYNIGLLYFQMGRYTEALAQEHRAAALGMPRTDLRDRLKAQGKWAEPAPSAASAAPAASAASTPGA